MIAIVLVGIGSFIGGVLRYGLSSWVYKALDNPWFPYGTLVVNTLGCLVIGWLAGLAEARAFFTSEVRLFIFVGILGGFTTFSSFALETFGTGHAKRCRTCQYRLTIDSRLAGFMVR
jgi:CrcB protein